MGATAMARTKELKADEPGRGNIEVWRNTTNNIIIVVALIMSATLFSGCLETELPEMYTVTVIDDMGITESSETIYNVYDIDYSVSGDDFWGNTDYTVVLGYYSSDGDTRYERTFYEINEIESVPQGRNLVHVLP